MAALAIVLVVISVTSWAAWQRSAAESRAAADVIKAEQTDRWHYLELETPAQDVFSGISVPFNPGQARLSKTAADQLRYYLEEFRTASKIVATTSTGGNPTGYDVLSEQRGAAIRAWLISHGVHAVFITYFSELQPRGQVSITLTYRSPFSTPIPAPFPGPPGGQRHSRKPGRSRQAPRRAGGG